MKTDSIWTANRKEAYEFAKLLTVVDGIDSVKVIQEHGLEFYVRFAIEHDIHEHSLYVELATLLHEYELHGINASGEQWAIAFDMVRTSLQ
ncbi:hypothetical protein ACWE42_12105 [Sutcliffiella cohnii]